MQKQQQEQQQETEWMQAFHSMTVKQRKLALAHIKRVIAVKPLPQLKLIKGGGGR